MHVEVFSLISDKIVAYSFTFDLPGKWLVHLGFLGKQLKT